MKTSPHLMLESIYKEGHEGFTNSTIIPEMMEKGEIIGLTGKYEFYSQNQMDEAMSNSLIIIYKYYL